VRLNIRRNEEGRVTDASISPVSAGNSNKPAQGDGAGGSLSTEKSPANSPQPNLHQALPDDGQETAPISRQPGTLVPTTNAASPDGNNQENRTNPEQNPESQINTPQEVNPGDQLARATTPGDASSQANSTTSGPSTSRPLGGAQEPVYDKELDESSDADNPESLIPLSAQDLSDKEDDASKNPQANKDKSSRSRSQELAEREQTGGDEAQLGAESDDDDSYYKHVPPKKSLGRFIGSRRRQAVAGGLIAAIVSIFFFFSLSTGSLQLIHFAQILKIHFESLSFAQDDRFIREIRLVKGIKTGHVERTRLGFVGNRVADKYELKLNKIGLESIYSNVRQVGLGWKVDRSKFPNMSDEEIKNYLKENFPGGDVVEGRSIGNAQSNLKPDDIVVRPPSGKTEGLQEAVFRLNLLKATGVNGLSAAFGTHLLATRDYFSLHPVKRALTKPSDTLEEKFNEKKKQANQYEENELAGRNEAEVITAESKPKKDANGKIDPKTQSSAEHNAEAARGILLSADEMVSGLKSGEGTSSITKFRNSLFSKSGALNAGLVYGAACIAKGIDSNYPRIKDSEVIKPLIRLGMFVVSLGDQMISGVGIDPDIVNQYASQLSGYVKGHYSSWIDGQAIQSDLGNPGVGVPPDDTLINIASNHTPFHFLNTQPIKLPLDAACSTTFQIGATVIGFLGGGIEQGLAGLINGAITSKVLEEAFSLWVGGAPVNSTVAGADRGNYADYGTVLAASDQAVMSGGTQLTPTEAKQLNSRNSVFNQYEFDHQDLAHRLFNPTDYNSAIAKVIDHTSSSPTHNIAALFGSMFNIRHVFGSMLSVFNGSAFAATPADYDYGFPIYGFSNADLGNPAIADPYQNAANVVPLLDDSGKNNNPDYITKAKKCFGVILSEDSQGRWNVTSVAGDKTPQLYNPHSYDSKSCGGPTTPSDCTGITTEACNWLRVRFFVFDTETINGMDCYLNNDNESCTDMGMGGGTGAQTSGSTYAPGTYVNPLRDVQKNGSLVAKRVDQGVDYGGSGPVYALGNGTLENITNGGWAVDGGPPTFIVYKLTDGPATGMYVFVAENCTPNSGLKIGQPVGPNTVLCTMVNSSPYIETGWAEKASPGAFGFALAHSVWGRAVDDESHYTASGQNFSDLLQSLGAPPGTIKDGAQRLNDPQSGSLPTW
ncbi:MAG TPA: hypothetical protein VFW90_01130, partial [Candidatus Saccharimonadales bacterium]|nr:hypothetical protein [Candidatus Saccharimonadales bacterium]